MSGFGRMVLLPHFGRLVPARWQRPMTGAGGRPMPRNELAGRPRILCLGHIIVGVIGIRDIGLRIRFGQRE